MWVRRGRGWGGVDEAALLCRRLRMTPSLPTKKDNIKNAPSVGFRLAPDCPKCGDFRDSRARFEHRIPGASQNLRVNVEVKRKNTRFCLGRTCAVACGEKQGLAHGGSSVEDIQVHSFLG